MHRRRVDFLKGRSACVGGGGQSRRVCWLVLLLRGGVEEVEEDLTDTLQQLRVAVVREEGRLQTPEVELQHAGHGVQVALAVRQGVVSCGVTRRGEKTKQTLV